MSRPDIHPEDLLDRTASELTANEAARLQAHLDACSVCRFEQQLRLDFDDETAAAGPVNPGADQASSKPAWTLSGVMRDAALSGPQPSEGDPPADRVQSKTPSVRPPISAGALRLSRKGGLIAAVVLFAGGAAAAAGWEALPSLVSSKETPAPTPSMTPTSGKTPAQPSDARGTRRAAPPTTPPEAPDSELAPQPPPTSTKLNKAASPRRVPKTSPGLGNGAAASETAPSAADTTTATAPTSASSDPGELFRTATRARQNKDYPTAIAAYQRIIRQHPDSAQARISRALLARLQLDLGRNHEAASGFEAVAKQPGPLSETALVGRARALRRMGRFAEEAAVWRQLLRRYPSSAHRAVAEARLRVPGPR